MTRSESTLRTVSRFRAVLCTLAALGASWLLLPVNDGGFDRYHLPKELWLTLLALGLVAPLVLKAEVLVWDAVTKLTLALSALTLAAMLAATSPALAVRGASLQLAASVLFLATRSLLETQRQRLRVWVVLALVGVAGLACAEIFGLVTQLSRTGRLPGASLGQRNMVAHLLALGAPCAFSLMARSQPRTGRWLGMLAGVLFTFTIVHTRSRAGWLALAAGLLLVELLARPCITRGLPSLLSALGVLLALTLPTQLVWNSATPYRDSLVHLLDGEQGSGRGRLAQYRSSLAMLGEAPVLGVGPGNWLVHYPAVSPSGDPAFRTHTWLNTGRLINSDLLALLLEQGPLALLLGALLVVVVLRDAVRGPDRGLVCATLGAGLVAGSLDAVLQLPAAVCCAALVLGSCAPGMATSERTSWQRPLAGLLVALLGAATLLSAGRLLALWERTRPTGGYQAMERALRWNPADLNARFALAEAYLLAGDCAHARPHIAALRRLLPYHQAPRDLEAGCPLSSL